MAVKTVMNNTSKRYSFRSNTPYFQAPRVQEVRALNLRPAHRLMIAILHPMMRADLTTKTVSKMISVRIVTAKEKMVAITTIRMITVI